MPQIITHTTYPRPAAIQRKQPAECSCPVCQGLECLERPRYFAGQLLTDAELNSEQNYVRAKNRLHNRSLHGSGVVCGLKVLCNDCEGQVTVEKGYAIDPCGEDIIVCAEQQFDVIRAIRECRDARRRRQRGDCDPYSPAPAAGCKEVEEHWCITIAYEEKEARPMTMLGNEKKRSCGCGSASPCGCGAGDAKAAGNGGTATARPGRLGVTLGGCEPTRVRESFRLAVIEEPEGCRVDLRRGDLATHGKSFGAGVADVLLEGTLLGKVVHCFQDSLAFIASQLRGNDRQIITSVVSVNFSLGFALGISAGDIHATLCRFRQAVIDLYLQDADHVRCQLLHTLDKITCPTPDEGEDALKYASRVREMFLHLAGMLVQHWLDCVCGAFLPPCAPDPHDERLILACVTIRGDKIINICNFGCRRYAGAFPSAFHWLSAVPVIPLLGKLLTALCCQPDLVRSNSPLVNDFAAWLARIDPAGKLRQEFLGGDFALPKNLAHQFGLALQKIAAFKPADFIRPGAVNLPALIGATRRRALEALGKGGVIPIEREVASESEAAALKNLRVNLFPAQGEKVILFKMKDKVLGFAPYSVEEQLAVKDAELQGLRREMDALKTEVRSMKRRK